MEYIFESEKHGRMDIFKSENHRTELLSENPEHYLRRHLDDIRIPANLVLDIIEKMHQDRKKRDKDLDNE